MSREPESTLPTASEDAESEGPVEIVPRSARARMRLRAAEDPAPAPKKSPMLLYAIGGGGALVLGLVLFFVLRGGKEDSTGTTPAESAAVPVAGNENSSPVVAPSTSLDIPRVPIVIEKGKLAPPASADAAPATPPKPAPAPVRPMAERIAGATTTADATELAREAEKLGDASAGELAWARVFALDPENAEARTKLDVRKLEPDQDLPGFEAIARTPQKVHLKPFYEASRDELPRAERAKVVANWEPARAKIEARIASARTTPYYDEVDKLRILMRDMPFFGDLQYEMVESRPPYALFIEVEGTPEQREKRRSEAEASYTPFLDAYDKKIRSYLFPLSPKLPDDEPAFPVYVFLNKERFSAYCVATSGREPQQRAHYEPWSKKCFTYTTVFKVGLGAFQEGTQVLLHEITHAWVDRLATADDGETRGISHAVATHWFSEGIAEYLSCHFLHQGTVQFQPWRSMRIGGGRGPKNWRIPMTKALAIPLHGLDAWAELQVPDLPPEKKKEAIGTISSGFYADMSNFILWLNMRSGANRPDQFTAYAREELAGRGGMEAFRRCLPNLLEEVPDLDATIDDFVKRIANGKINPYKEMAEQKPPAPAAPAAPAKN